MFRAEHRSPQGSCPEKLSRHRLLVIEKFRLYWCSRCFRVVVVCRRCDRNQHYCSKTCSRLARREALRREAASAGFYSSPYGGKYPRIQLLTAEELLKGKGLLYPAPGQTNVSLRKTRAVAVRGEQIGLPGIWPGAQHIGPRCARKSGVRVGPSRVLILPIAQHGCVPVGSRRLPRTAGSSSKCL